MALFYEKLKTEIFFNIMKYRVLCITKKIYKNILIYVLYRITDVQP